MPREAIYVWRAGRSTPANQLIQLYLFIYFSYIVRTFRYAALKPAVLVINRRRNGELPLLPLGAAAGKRHIQHRYQHQSILKPGFVSII